MNLEQIKELLRENGVVGAGGVKAARAAESTQWGKFPLAPRCSSIGRTMTRLTRVFCTPGMAEKSIPRAERNG